MSTTIDSRVVEMRFDNKHFEQNVQTSMSTLEKLKQKLHLDGATKGLENVNAAANKVNFSGMTSAVEAVGLKFNAMYSIADQALRNITNSAMAAGKRIVNALTIDPVKTGFSEYETKINAVQTIMSNTSSKGTTMEDVTKTLNELNTYADKTIYNFAEMTRNIGTFTAAGVGLEESAAAIQGIANLAAASGSNSQQASTAMYQLSQALAAGKVQLMDWNSVVNAGMGGEKFQEALKATAREHGIAVDSMIKDAGSFRESLKDGWMTADVLNTTLQKFTVEGAKQYADAMVKSGKYTKEQADALIKEAQAMEDAATKVKTFTQLWDTMKESVQSGWAQTWEIIIGDFEEAKGFLSGLSDRFGEIFGKSAEKRNSILEKALGGSDSKWDSFIEKINKAGVSTEDFNKALKETARESGISLDKIVKGNFNSLEEAVTSGALSTELIVGALGKLADAGNTASGSTEDLNEKLKYFQKVVDEVWHGDFKNGEERIRALEEAGYDYAQVQTLVNKTVDGHRLTLDDLSDAQLVNLGYTEEQITAIRKLAKEAEKSGTPLHELIEDMQKPSGRELLIQSINNALDGLTDACKAVKTAWDEVFPPKSTEEKAAGLYGIIEAIHAFSESLKGLYDEEGNLTETGDKLVRSLKGLFAIIDLITTITGGAFKIAFKIVSKLLSMFDMDILDLTAVIGDAIVGFRDFIDSVFDVGAAIDKIVPYLVKGVNGIKDWIEGLKAADNIPKYIFEGLVNGLKGGAEKVWNAIVSIGTGILTKIKDVLGIHSPSTEFYEIGKFIVIGLFNGISDTIGIVWRLVKNIGIKLAEYLGKVDFGAIMIGGLYAGIMYSLVKLINVVDKFAAPFEGLGDVLESTSKFINTFRKGLKKMMNAKALEIQSKALLNMAIAIGILAASVWVLAQLDTGKLWGAIAAITVLAAVIAGMVIAASKIGDFKDGGKLALILVGVAASVLIMALAMKQLSKIKAETIPVIIATLATAVVALIGILVLLNELAKNKAHVARSGATIVAISVALLLMVGVIKLASTMDPSDVGRGLLAVGAVTALFAALMFVSQFAGKHAAKAGSMMLSMSLALLTMIGVIKLAGSLDGDEIGKGIVVVGMLGALFAAMMFVSQYAGKYAGRAGVMMLSMSVALLIAVAVIKIAAGLTDDGIDKASDVIFTLGALFAAVVIVSQFAGKHAMKAGVMLLAMSAALLIMTGVLYLLSRFKPDGLDQAMDAMEKLMTLFAVLIAVSGVAGDSKGAIIALTVAIGLLVLSLMALTFIDPKKLTTSVAALSVIIIAFAALVKSASSLNGAKKMIGPLIAMMGALLIVAGVVVVLSQLDAEANIQTALALSVLLIALATSMKIASGIKTVSGSALGAMAAMGLVVAELAVILGLMSHFDVEASIPTAIALGVLLNAMAAAMIILKFAGTSSMAGIGALAVMGLVVGELAVILGLMAHFNVNPSIETAGALSVLLVSMSASLILLGVVGLMGPAALIGIGVLAVLIAGIGGLLVGIGALMDKFPQLEGFLDKGIPVLEKIGHALGSFFGNIVGGFLGGALSFIPDLGTHLSNFMTNLQPFLEGARAIDSDVMGGVKTLAETILILTGAGILEGLTSWITGGSSFESFGSQLSGMGSSLKSFASEISEFSEEDVTAITNAANAIKVMAQAADAIPNSGGWLGKLVGENDMDTFGAMLPKVGGYLTSFVSKLGLFGEDQIKTVECASTAIVKMAEAADKIPNQGGWLAAIVGDNTIVTFGAQLPMVGTFLSQFAMNLGTFSDEQSATIGSAANAIVKLAEAANKIPNQGGWLAWIVGDNTIATFGLQLPLVGTCLSQFAFNLGTFSDDQVKTIACASDAIVKMAEAASNIDGQTAWGKVLFGENSIANFATEMESVGGSLAGFVSNLGTFSNDQVATVTCAANAIKLMAEAATHIDGQSEWGKKLFGDNGLGAFGKEMEGVGTSLATFVSNLGTFTTAQVSTVNCAVDAIKTIASLSGTNLVTVKDNLPGFGDTLEGLGDDITAFCDSMPSNESISTASKNLKVVLDMIDDVAASNATAAKNFTDSLKNLGKDGVASFVEAFSGTVAKAEAKSAATKLMEQAISGIESKATAVKTALTGIASDGVTALRDKYQSFYNAGSYLVSGFAAGISENDYKAEAKARAMAKAAAQAAEDALDINSPSKVFRAIGSSVPEGFALGIEKIGAVTSAAKDMAKCAFDNVKSSIARLADMVEGDMDTQPTIRPVLDLSDVRSGAGAISSLFGSGASVGVLTNVSEISNSMRNRQNGTDNELVSEIRKLRKDVGGISKPSYNINGITYDDGSNVANAVGALVRAAKVERRI